MGATYRRTALVSLWLVTASAAGAQEGPKVNEVEYEGWRQYNVHCARCHGQDALPNPVTANLLTSLGPGGPAAASGRRRGPLRRPVGTACRSSRR